jgi:fibronectin-binding autotransporter adhesin
MLSNKTSSRKRFALIHLAAISSLGAASALATTQTSTWTDGGGDSNWSNSANWSPSGAPNNGTNGFSDYNVIIGTPSPTNVNNDFTIDSLTLNSGGSLNVLNNTGLTLDGPSLTNNSTITINSNQGGNNTILTLIGVTETGSGAIVLDNSNALAQLNGLFSQSSTNTISGFGDVNAELTNGGTVNADVNGQALTLQSNGMTNNSLFEATGGGSLNIGAIAVTQGSGGSIVAGTASTVNLINSTISGGTLKSTGTTAAIQVTGGSTTSTISSLTNDATLNVVNNNQLNVTGNLANNGTITVNSNQGGNTTVLDFTNGGTLSGTGTIILNNSTTLAQLNGSLTQASGSTISGLGDINAALTNNGTVNANVSSQALNLQTSAMTNNATFEATNGATLSINSITVTQGTAGVVSAGAASAVNLVNSTISGGTLKSTGSGVIQATGTTTSTIDSLTNDATLNIINNNTLDVTGDLTDNGTITVNSNQGGNTTILSFNGGTLSGTGTIVLNNSGTTSQLDGSLTQASGHTIEGFGQIPATLTNQGTVNANVASTTLEVRGASVTNTSLMTATNGGELLFDNGVAVTNTGGQITANGGTVVFSGASLTGGTLSATSPSIIVADNSTFGSGITIKSGTQVNADNNTELNVTGGTLTNNGTITVNPQSAGNTTIFNFAGNTLLAGTGTVVLNSGAAAAQLNTGVSATLTQVATQTIQGFGQINAALVSSGTVNANVTNTTLTLQSNAMTNNAVFEATNAGVLNINGIAVTQGASGTITAVNGITGTSSYVVLNSATVSGGTLTTTGTGIIEANGTSTINNVTNDGVLYVLNNEQLNVGGNLTNNGTITVNPTAQGNTTVLDFTGGTISGTGTIILNSLNGAAQLNGTLTQASAHTISGYGDINAALTNNGVVNANVNGQVLNLLTSAMTNNLTFEATSGGSLNIGAITITQGAAGVVSAATGSVVNLTNSTINDGTLKSAGTGLFQIFGTSTVGSLTSDAVVNIPNNQQLNVTGNLINNSTITVNPTAQGNTTVLDFTGGTLSGTGSIILNSLNGAAQLDGTLTQASTQTTSGFGEINAALTNNGIVNANVTNQAIKLMNSNMTNSATFEATNGGTLAINGITVTQGTSGTISAIGGVTGTASSVVSMSNATIVGGTLTSTGIGFITADNNSTFGAGITISAGTQVNLDNNNELFVTGPTLTNNGTITINPQAGGNGTNVDFTNGTTLSGSGTIVLNGVTSHAQINGTLTQSSAHTIEGFGLISALFTNNGTVNANVSGQELEVSGPTTTNNSLMEATNGGLLRFDNIVTSPSTINNAGGTISAVGGPVDFIGVTLNGGTISSSNSNVITADNSDFGTGITITTGSQVNLDNNNALDVTGGTLTNNGTITINPQAGGNGTLLTFTADTLLTGTGSIVLHSGGGNAQINTSSTVTLTQASTHTISGFGEINATLINKGTVDANASGQTLSVNGPTTNDGLLEATGAGTLAINGAVTLGAGGQVTAGIISAINVNPSGSVALDGTALSNSGSVTVAGSVSGGTLEGTGGLTINSSGVVQLLSGSGLSQQGSLSISNSGTLDITNNMFDVNFGSGVDPAASIRSYLVSGYNSVGGTAGNWKGTGITSSTAAADPSKFAVGYADGGNPTDVANTGVQTGKIVIEYTVAGDANLSGTVDLSDLVIVASDFGDSGADWAEGDVNYSGTVDLSDLVIVASNFGASLSSVNTADFSGSFAAEWNLALAEVHGADVQVPEPVGLAALAAAGLLLRRRRAR